MVVASYSIWTQMAKLDQKHSSKQKNNHTHGFQVQTQTCFWCTGQIPIPYVADAGRELQHYSGTKQSIQNCISERYGCSQVPSNRVSGKNMKHFFHLMMQHGRESLMPELSTFKDLDQSCQEVWDTSSSEDQVWGPTKNIHSCSLHDWAIVL